MDCVPQGDVMRSGEEPPVRPVSAEGRGRREREERAESREGYEYSKHHKSMPKRFDNCLISCCCVAFWHPRLIIVLWVGSLLFWQTSIKVKGRKVGRLYGRRWVLKMRNDEIDKKKKLHVESRTAFINPHLIANLFMVIYLPSKK